MGANIKAPLGSIPFKTGVVVDSGSTSVRISAPVYLSTAVLLTLSFADSAPHEYRQGILRSNSRVQIHYPRKRHPSRILQRPL